MSEGRRNDIWTLVKEKKERDKKNGVPSADDSAETTLLVCGSRNSGKTTLIHRLRGKDDVPTPTVALEYRYARNNRGTAKDVCHIFELAGGTHLSDLLDIPINESNVHMTTYIVVADLSNPSESVQMILHFLSTMHSRVANLLGALESKGSRRPASLKAHAIKRYGAGHPDLDCSEMNILPVPICIIGSKYDVFRDFEPEKRKSICRLLRYIAHVNGASLVFANLKDELYSAKARKLLNHHAFRTALPQEMVVDHNKPVIVIAGQDAIGQIGAPPTISNKDSLGKSAPISLQIWLNEFNRHFATKQTEQVAQLDLSMYPEPAVDAMRAQKDEEFRKTRKVGGSQDVLSYTAPKGKPYSRSRASQMEPM